MRKISLALLIIALTAGTLQAQEKSGFVGIKAGPSFPVGKYASKELPDGGFALTGFSTSVEGAWFFKPWIGIGANAGLNFHPVDAGELGYAKLMENPFLVDLSIRSEAYRTINAYAGLFFRKPIADRLYITGKALGGFLFASTPYQLYKAEYYLVGKNWYDKTSAGDYEASFMAGLGITYLLKNYIGFSLDGEFTYNQCDFNFLTNTGETRTDKIVFSYVNVTLGVFVKIE